MITKIRNIIDTYSDNLIWQNSDFSYPTYKQMLNIFLERFKKDLRSSSIELENIKFKYIINDSFCNVYIILIFSINQLQEASRTFASVIAFNFKNTDSYDLDYMVKEINDCLLYGLASEGLLQLFNDYRKVGFNED